MRTLPRIALFLLLPIACSRGDVRDAGDVDALATVVPTEEIRIGSRDDPDVGFSEIAGVETGIDGRVYVLDRQARQVRVYDRDGARIGAFGGAGEGPGEFRLAFSLGMVGDTVWVDDPVLRRLTLFDRDGGFLRTIDAPTTRLEMIPGMPAQFIGDRPRADGWFHTTGGAWALPASATLPKDSIWLPHVRIDATGTRVDTLWLQRYAFPDFTGVTLGGRELYRPVVPTGDPLWIEDGDGFVKVERPIATSADRAAFTVTRVAGMADTLWHRTFTCRPHPFTDEAVDAIIARAVEPFRHGGDIDPDAAAAAFRDAITPPAYFPPVSDGRVGRDGTIWLRREDEPGQTARWLILRADGAPAAGLELPASAVIHWSDGDVGWVSVRDSLDVPWLIRYRLPGLNAGS